MARVNLAIIKAQAKYWQMENPRAKESKLPKGKSALNDFWQKKDKNSRGCQQRLE